MNRLQIRSILVLGVVLFAGIISLSGCGDAPSAPGVGQAALPEVSIGRFAVPKFPTAAGQLDYAKSRFPDPMEKRAALTAVGMFYPEAGRQKGEAALDLAYLHLGGDYRLADRGACRQAVARYRDIAEGYADLPEISVKAHWYLGWIHSDLLGEKRLGIASYRVIVERFPDVKMDHASPVPWVSIVYPDPGRDDPPAYDKPSYHWAGLALLEIIRITADEIKGRTTALAAFHTLWNDYRGSIATGLALKHLLGKPLLARKVRPFVRDYLERKGVSEALAADIRRAARQGAETGDEE